MTDDENPERCTAVLDFPEQPNTPYPCTLVNGHEGPHRDRDGDAWTITFQEREQFPGGGESVSQRLDRVFLGVREEIRALADHMAKEIATVRVSSAIPVYRAPEDERDGNYLHGRTHGDLIRELYQRISELEGRRLPDIRRSIAGTNVRVSKLEDRMSPPVVRGPEPNEDRPCTAVLKLNGYTERTCDAGSHQGPHRDPGSGDIWETEQKGAVQVSRARFDELVRRSSQLTALETAGVDNWEGYSNALRDND